MRAVAQIAQSVEQGIENPHDSFYTTTLDSTHYKASLTMRGLFVMRLWSISGQSLARLLTEIGIHNPRPLIHHVLPWQNLLHAGEENLFSGQRLLLNSLSAKVS